MANVRPSRTTCALPNEFGGFMQNSEKLTFSCHAPTELLGEVSALFAANEREEFPAWAAEAYAYAEARGAVSWVGRSADGRCVAHMGRWPMTLMMGAEAIRASLCVNMMVDRGHRTLLPALALARTVLNDARSANFDFAFANPLFGGAYKVLATVGMKQVGEFSRLVQPVSHRILPGSLLLGALHSMNAVLVGRWHAREVPLREAIDGLSMCEAELPAPFAVRHSDLYGARLGGFVASTDVGVILRGGRADAFGAAVLRLDHTEKRARLVSIRTTRFTELAGAASAVGSLAARFGMRFVEGGAASRGPQQVALRAAGFSVRSETAPLQALAFTEAGERAVAALGSSALEPIDAD